jgi:hypothetical protein
VVFVGCVQLSGKSVASLGTLLRSQTIRILAEEMLVYGNEMDPNYHHAIIEGIVAMT